MSDESTTDETTPEEPTDPGEESVTDPDPNDQYATTAEEMAGGKPVGPEFDKSFHVEQFEEVAPQEPEAPAEEAPA